jgi:hypothetical protein
VDIRPGSHTESLDREYYGFGPPAVEEFRRRHGVNLAKDAFDRAAWRRLRGDFYTMFLREASAAARSRGRELFAHVVGRMDAAAEEPCWIHEGLLDGATMSDVAGSFRSRVRAVCRGRSVPTYSRPSLHSADDATWAGRGRTLLDQAVRDGDRGFNVYESAAVLRLGADGKLSFRAPALWDRLAAPP